jgi:hypothetical protein
MAEKGTSKSRILNHFSGICFTDNYSGGAKISVSQFPYSIIGKQVTVSGSHPEFFVKRHILKELQHQKFPGKEGVLQSLRELDIGGNFWTQKQKYVHGTKSYALSANGFFDSGYQFRGTMFPQYSTVGPGSSAWQSSTLPMQDEFALLLAKGATAIARTVPTRPSFSLATALGELRRDGIPTVLGASFLKVRSLKSAVKAAGNEYLNLEFAWKPFIGDIRKLCSAVMKSEDIIAKYEKESGQIIGRNYSFPDERTILVEDKGGAVPSPALPTSMYVTYLGNMRKTTEVVTHTWFEGRFRYNLPEGTDARSQIKLAAAKAEHLLGLRLTPEVLWNLQPWSWLSDWFVNVGDLMTNFTAFGTDELSLTRGYIMKHSFTKVTWDLNGIVFKDGPAGTISQSFETETKMRLKASPWGFGVTFSGFTPRQIAILAALGVTRNRVTPW